MYRRATVSAIATSLVLLAATAHAQDFTDRDLVPIKADPGVPRAKSMKPAWCDLVGPQTNSNRNIGYIERAMKNKYFYEKYWTSIPTSLCAGQNLPGYQKQTGYFLQRFMNITGLDTKGAIASIRARLADKGAKWKREKKQFCDKLEVSDEASPAQKRHNDALNYIYGCYRAGAAWTNPQVTLGKKIEWDIDRDAEVADEAVKAYYVLGCFKDAHNASLKHKGLVAPYALCGMDARSLSAKRLAGQLAGSQHNDYSRSLARETFASAMVATRRMRAVVDKLIKRDTTYKKVFVDVPQAAWNQWKALRAAHKSAFDAARAFELKLYGPSRSAMKGCLAPLRKQLGDYVAAKKPKTQKALEAALFDQVGSTLLAALMPCAAVDGNKWEASTYMRLYKKAGHVRGPRYAAYYAVVNAITTIKKDRPRFPLTVRSFPWKHGDDPYARYSHLAKSGISKEGHGAVKRIKRMRDGVQLQFKTVRWREPIWDCRSNGQIYRINSNGTVEYHENCTAKGFQWKKHTEKPVTIPSYAAAGIRRGSFVEFYADYPSNNPKQVRDGFPWRVYRSKNKKKLTAAYGYKL